MNKPRRKELEQALSLLGQARDIIESVKDDETDAYENLPESFQESERGEQMFEYIDSMDESLSYIDDVADRLNDIVEG